MNLLERARSLTENLARMEELTDQQDEIKELGDSRLAFSSHAEAVRQCKVHVQFLRRHAIAVDIDQADIRTTKKLIVEIRQRMQDKPAAQTLKKGNHWSSLQEKLPQLSKQLDKDVRNAWSQHVKSMLLSETPERVHARAAQTTENKKWIAQYRDAYLQMAREALKLPVSDADVTRVQTLATGLDSVYKRIDFDVPQAVRDFLAAVATSSGAPLDLLTDDVRQWLAARNEQGLYSIKVKVF